MEPGPWMKINGLPKSMLQNQYKTLYQTFTKKTKTLIFKNMLNLCFNSCVVIKTLFYTNTLFCLNSVGIFFCPNNLSKMFSFKTSILYIHLCQSTMTIFINNGRVKNNIFPKYIIKCFFQYFKKIFFSQQTNFSQTAQLYILTKFRKRFKMRLEPKATNLAIYKNERK